jgi:hypothetical protein
LQATWHISKNGRARTVKTLLAEVSAIVVETGERCGPRIFGKHISGFKATALMSPVSGFGIRLDENDERVRRRLDSSSIYVRL